jgi:hypothetical protein
VPPEFIEQTARSHTNSSPASTGKQADRSSENVDAQLLLPRRRQDISFVTVSSNGYTACKTA